jgi:amidase
MANDAFEIVEATIGDIRRAMAQGTLTARGLVQAYLDRIAAYDQKGPAINAVISLNPSALEEADALDRAYAARGPVGSLHGVVVLVKDQVDVDGLPTTLGSVLFEGHMPGRDAFAIARLKERGAIILGKVTLGELGAGDTHGSLFGSTRCVYDLERTAGGSSGGSGAAVSANFCTVALGQEGFASIRRPAIWNGVAGMRPTAGLVSRQNVYGGWPMINGSLGPMARSVADLALLLDGMVGYDPKDPLTAMGVGHIPPSYAAQLDGATLRGARVGILREPMGFATDPASEDFALVDEVFSRAVEELREAGAEVVDPVVIPDLATLLATRARDAAEEDAMFAEYVSGSPTAPFATRAEAMASPLFEKVTHGARTRWLAKSSPEKHYAYLRARETLMIRLHQVMAEHRLDAIIHKAVEHQPTLISEGVNPPWRDQRGAPFLNTSLVFVPSVVVPAGFTRAGLPAGITFLGRPYEDAAMLRLAYAYEQATRHRRPPAATP